LQNKKKGFFALSEENMSFFFTLRFFTNAKRGEKKAQRKKEIVCMVGLVRANLINDAYFFLHHAPKSGARFSKK